MIESNGRRAFRLSFQLDKYPRRPLLRAYLFPRWRVGLVAAVMRPRWALRKTRADSEADAPARIHKNFTNKPNQIDN